MGAPEQPTETWCAGDMAECINDDWTPWGKEPLPPRAPAIGDRALVLRVASAPCCDCGQFFVVLQLLGFPGGLGWDATGFRKIVAPDVGADRRVDRPVEELV